MTIRTLKKGSKRGSRILAYFWAYYLEKQVCPFLQRFQKWSKMTFETPKKGQKWLKMTILAKNEPKTTVVSLWSGVGFLGGYSYLQPCTIGQGWGSTLNLLKGPLKGSKDRGSPNTITGCRQLIVFGTLVCDLQRVCKGTGITLTDLHPGIPASWMGENDKNTVFRYFHGISKNFRFLKIFNKFLKKCKTF